MSGRCVLEQTASSELAAAGCVTNDGKPSAWLAVLQAATRVISTYPRMLRPNRRPPLSLHRVFRIAAALDLEQTLTEAADRAALEQALELYCARKRNAARNDPFAVRQRRSLEGYRGICSVPHAGSEFALAALAAAPVQHQPHEHGHGLE